MGNAHEGRSNDPVMVDRKMWLDLVVQVKLECTNT